LKKTLSSGKIKKSEPAGREKNAGGDRKYYFFALRIVGDFGVAIAAPVIVLVLIGQYLDTRYHRQVLFTILAFILAALLSAYIIYRKAKKYGKQYQQLK